MLRPSPCQLFHQLKHTHTKKTSRLCVPLFQEAVLQRHQACTQEAIPSQTRLDLTTHNRQSYNPLSLASACCKRTSFSTQLSLYVCIWKPLQNTCTAVDLYTARQPRSSFFFFFLLLSFPLSFSISHGIQHNPNWNLL